MDTPNVANALPSGWILVERYEGPTAVVLRFSRVNASRHWLIAVGATDEEALHAGRHRMRLYDEIDHGPVGPTNPA